MNVVFPLGRPDEPESKFPDPYEGMTPDELDRHFASVLAAKAAEIERLREIERAARAWAADAKYGETDLLAALSAPRGETP